MEEPKIISAVIEIKEGKYIANITYIRDGKKLTARARYNSSSNFKFLTAQHWLNSQIEKILLG
jgi:hypothetical protein